MFSTVARVESNLAGAWARIGTRAYRAMLLSVFAAAAACSSMPVQEVSDAQQAIGAARVAGGERYTPETLQAAEALVNRALDDLANGNYHAARTAALSAKKRAILAREVSRSAQAYQ
jgi:hypothetical protein